MSLILGNAQISDAATYEVIVTNGIGSVTSDSAVLTILDAADDGTPQLRIHRPL